MICKKGSTLLEKHISTMTTSHMWDAVILTGKQALLPFELFQNLQRTHSWMKYYNSELESRRGMTLDEKVLKDLLKDVVQNINGSLLMLKQDKILH